jgi:hypothetical protein
MIQNYFDNVKEFLGSFTSNARTRESWGKGIYLLSFLKIIGSPAKRDWGWEAFPQFCVSRISKQKNFRFLKRKNFGGAQLKNVKKIFLFCSPKRSGGGRKRWAGQSAKSSGFCSKKVLTSSSKHHQIELAASPSPSARASVGRFARNRQGFLKSIDSFCSLIWRYANLKSLWF